jgi:hypothetical protein
VLVCGKDLVCRAADFEKRAVGLSLRPWQWEFLFALDGQMSLAEIARCIGIDMLVASETVRLLHEQGLIVVASVRIEEYRQDVGTEAITTSASEDAFSGMPTMLPPVNVPAPSMGVAFSLKAPSSPGNTPTSPSSGSIGFKIK